jgi:hypothetical protein
MEPLAASAINHPAPTAFSPQHDATSKLYRVDLNRVKLKPGKYRVAIAVTHTLLTGTSQQNVTRAQQALPDEKSGAVYYLSFQHNIQVRLWPMTYECLLWLLSPLLATVSCISLEIEMSCAPGNEKFLGML